MDRVTGIGGIFFKAKDPKKLQEWYRDHLGLPVDPAWGGCVFEWKEPHAPDRVGQTVWSTFPETSKKFAPGTASFMINYRVADLHALVAALRQEGLTVDDVQDDPAYGKFSWVVDPEGNRIELWEPPAESPQG
jgi:catechol 2,3-dioxygenase-like lactoylglutathione lyase family enzyme